MVQLGNNGDLDLGITCAGGRRQVDSRDERMGRPW